MYLKGHHGVDIMGTGSGTQFGEERDGIGEVGLVLRLRLDGTGLK